MAIGLSTSFSSACRVFREPSTTRRFINYLASEWGDKEQHLMQMWLCTTIITNISWSSRVARACVGRLQCWLACGSANCALFGGSLNGNPTHVWITRSRHEWDSSRDEWRRKKRNVIFLSSITQFRGPGTQKPIHPIVIHENEILARDRDRSISLEILLVRLRL